MNTVEARAGGAWLLLMLGALMMLPPLSIDISLPGLPLIARALDATPALVQWTLSAFIFAFGVAQLIVGPLADRYGRRPVLLWGLAIFTIASAGCTVATDARWLIGWRLVQGIGACAGVVCARAVAQDLSSDRAGGTFRQTVLSLVNFLAPVIAPLIGAAILALLGWRQIYGALAIIGLALTAMIAFGIRETGTRTSTDVLVAYARVLRLPRTAGLGLAVGASFFGYFSLITGSPFALITQLHVTSTQFAIAFAINASALIVAALISGRIVHKVDPEVLLAAGIGIILVASIATYAVDTFAPTVIGFVATWSLYAFGIALTMPGSYAAVLHDARRDAGLASGLMGASQMLFGAVGSTLTGVMTGEPTAALGILGAAGGIGCVAAYALSRPPLGEKRKLSES